MAGFSLRGLVAQFNLHRARGRMPHVQHSFRSELHSVRRMLVMLPVGLRELTLIKSFLPQLNGIFKGCEMTLLAQPGIAVTDIYPRKGYGLLTPGVDQLGWSGIPKKTFVKQLQDMRFDLIMDLALEPSPFTSSVLLSFPDAIRVGRGNYLGQPYYNLEIKTKYLRDEKHIYRSMIETLDALMNKSAASAQSETEQ